MIRYQRSLTLNFHNLVLAQMAVLAYDNTNRKSRFANPIRRPTFKSCVADGLTQECFSALDDFAMGIDWPCVTVVWSDDD